MLLLAIIVSVGMEVVAGSGAFVVVVVVVVSVVVLVEDDIVAVCSCSQLLAMVLSVGQEKNSTSLLFH